MNKTQVAILGVLFLAVLAVLAVGAVLVLSGLDTTAQSPAAATEVAREAETGSAATTPEVVEEAVPAVEPVGETVVPSQGWVEITDPSKGYTAGEVRVMVEECCQAHPDRLCFALPVDPTKAKIWALWGARVSFVAIEGPVGLEIVSPYDATVTWQSMSGGDLRLPKLHVGITPEEYVDAWLVSQADGTYPDLGHGWWNVQFHADDSNWVPLDELPKATPGPGEKVHLGTVATGERLFALKTTDLDTEGNWNKGQVRIGFGQMAWSAEEKEYVGARTLTPADLLRDPDGNIVYVLP